MLGLHLGHIGIFVRDLSHMTAFYQGASDSSSQTLNLMPMGPAVPYSLAEAPTSIIHSFWYLDPP